jgi:PAS domain S-box-containing protein
VSRQEDETGHNDIRTADQPDRDELAEVRETLREKTATLAAVNRIGLAIASQSDVQAILQLVTDSATRLIGAGFGAFFYNTVNEQGEAFTLYTISGADPAAFRNFPLPRATALFGPTFRGESNMRVDDVLAHPLYGRSAPHHGMPPGHPPVRSYLAVPVVSRSGRVFGGLFFGHGEPGRFTANHESGVTFIAAQAAVALDNARLAEANRSAQRQLAQLNETLEAKVAERTAELFRSEQQFRQLVAGVNDCAIYMLDSDGRIATWNKGAERIKGYQADEIIGRHFSAFYTPEDRARGMPVRALEIALSAGKYEAETWRMRKDGTMFWASVLIDPVFADDGRLLGYAKITRDMTERRAIQEQLHQAQKMEAIGQLTGGVAHDFNNLLTVILGNLQTLSRQIAPEETRMRRAVELATRGAQRAAVLTSQLLSFARRQPLNPKPTDANQLVSRMSDLFRRTIGENIEIETVRGAGLWRADVDPNQLESALLNLAVNARDAMPGGGKLTIETANAHVDEHYAARYADISPGQYIVICVSDTGTGMTSEVLARAIDPFFTTKAIGEGTGLGLSQVFGFVKQSGGYLKLYSEVGQGTTVKLYFPRLVGAPAEDEALPVTPEPRGTASETILIVEDEADVRAYSVESLTELGFSVLEANDGPSALRVLEAHPEVTLLFTDVGLPGMDGKQLVEQTTRRWPRLKILYTSGYARNAIVHQGRLDPGVELLAKPFTREQLALRVRAMLDAEP